MHLLVVGRQLQTKSMKAIPVCTCLALMAAGAAFSAAQTGSGEHAQIGVVETGPNNRHTRHPDAQWFPSAGLGLFIHWDEGSVQELETSWPMMAGRGRSWSTERKPSREPVQFTPAEFERIVREKDYGQGPNQVTPNQYWALAQQFNPTDFHPTDWLRKAKVAGFTYAVFTAKHHSGFAMWPSAYGGFSTLNTPMKGRDLVREYVDACRTAGLKVGLYYSGPDWHFNREYQNFLYSYGGMAKGYPELQLDADHNPRRGAHTPEETAAHQKAFAAMVRGQITELLTRYGKIDVIWFDGRPPIPDPATTVMSLEEIRQLQPGIVINNRFHGRGDFVTPEGKLSDQVRMKTDEWGEFCSAWGYGWSYTGWKCRPLNEVLTNLVRARAAGVNYLLNIGPMASGDLSANIYENLDRLTDWMRVNDEAIHGTRALPGNERADVPAAAKGANRYLFLIPDRGKSRDQTVTFTGLAAGYRAQLLGSDLPLAVKPSDLTLTIAVPPSVQTDTVRVIKLSPKTP